MAKYRWCIFILITILILTSCNGHKPADEESQSTDDADTHETGGAMVPFVTDGKAVFDIIYPDRSVFTKVSVWVDQIKSAIKQKSGVAPLAYHDGQTARSEYLILLGDTVYDESVSAMQSLGIGGYSVTLQDRYIVISATDDMSMIKAVNWFCNVLLAKTVSSENGKRVILPFEEIQNQGTAAEKQLLIEGNKLSFYTVIYPMNDSVCKEAATKLRSDLSAYFGMSLKLSNDQNPESDMEILIGKTNRAESRMHSEAYRLEPMQYEYRVINKKISILGFHGSGYGTAMACDLFLENLMTEQTVNLKENFNMKQTIQLKEDPFAGLTDGADIRVMTANILSEEWGGTACLPRAEILYANLMYYKPDVVGAQEVSIQWTQALHTVLDGSRYGILFDRVPGTDSNYCPIIYNQDTLDVIASGAYRLAIGGPAKARTVTWGVFREKASGKEFAVLNTHLDWILDTSDYETTGPTSHYSREMQVRELAATFVELQEQYPEAEIVMTADWNTLKNAHPLDILCELTLTKFAQDVVPDNDWGNEVDHIFVQPDTKVLRLHLYRDNATNLGATDHPWGFADIQLR